MSFVTMSQYCSQGWWNLKVTYIHGNYWRDEQCNAKLSMPILFSYVICCDNLWMYFTSSGSSILSKFNVYSMWQRWNVCWLMLATFKSVHHKCKCKNQRWGFVIYKYIVALDDSIKCKDKCDVICNVAIWCENVIKTCTCSVKSTIKFVSLCVIIGSVI